MKNTLIRLAETHYEFGLIDFAELDERIDVALWLADELPASVIDPRDDSIKHSDEDLEDTKEDNAIQPGVSSTISNSNDDDWLELTLLNAWVFTKSDPDPYPSVPHGHYKNKNNKWPKLNPFTGRVFDKKHLEDSGKRLSKRQLRQIWTDEKFKSFCREMIIWYREMYPHHVFPVRRPLRLPRW